MYSSVNGEFRLDFNDRGLKLEGCSLRCAFIGLLNERVSQSIIILSNSLLFQCIFDLNKMLPIDFFCPNKLSCIPSVGVTMSQKTIGFS